MAQSNTTPMALALDWKAALWASLIAGAVLLIMEMVLVAVVQGESPWAPPRMIAAIVLGQDVLPPPATFDLPVVLAAMAVHFVLAFIYALIFAWIASRWLMSRGVAILAGGAFGLALYLINFYPIAAALFPWFAMARNWISILSHIAFGAVLALSYVGLAKQASLAEQQAR